MVIVVDANILIQCIINIKGKTAALILNNASDLNFVVPEFVISETKSKEHKIYSSSKKKQPLFEENLNLLLSTVVTINDDDISENIFKRAYEIVRDIDPCDVVPVALAIALEALLWTDDFKLQRGLRRKGFRGVITTKEFKENLKGL